LLVVCAAREAAASGARVRWVPSDDERVAGYNLYVRAAQAPYGGPVDVGLPPPTRDGTLAAIVNDLFPDRPYHLAVTAYIDDGVESALSAELALGDANPCVVDECVSATECDFRPVPDGTWCVHAGDSDPCTAVGACVAGTCGANAVAAGRLTTSRVRIAMRRGEGRLTARATFTTAAGFDPTTTGATFELADPNGRIVYRASVPGEVFDGFREGTVFQYLANRRQAREYNGLRVVGLFLSGRTATVRVHAESVELRAALAQPALRWTLRFGDACARDLALTCRPMIVGGISCR
jgi:hypothetical protein